MVGCPIIGINDSGGARIQDAATSLAWYAELGRRHELLSRPGAADLASSSANALGERSIRRSRPIWWSRCATRATCSSPVPTSSRTSPARTSSLDELGGADAQAKYGNIHQVVEDEEAAFQYVRDYLGFLPPNTFDSAPIVNPGLEPEVTPHDLELDSIVPDADNMAYDMHEILLRIFDDGDFLEVAAQAGQAIITGFARVDGRPVGVIANQPMYMSGAIDNEESDKAARFVRFCDAFNVPLVFVVDTPASCRASSRRRAESSSAAGDSCTPSSRPTCPKVTITIRKSYGGAYAVMGIQAADRRHELRVADRAHRGDRCRRCRAAAGEAVPRPDRARGAEDQGGLHRGLQPEPGDARRSPPSAATSTRSSSRTRPGC